jgi:hypothetical protein
MRAWRAVRNEIPAQWRAERAQLFGATAYPDCPVCAVEAAAVYLALGPLASFDLDKPIRALVAAEWLASRDDLAALLLKGVVEKLLGSAAKRLKWDAADALSRSPREIVVARALAWGGCRCPRS